MSRFISIIVFLQLGMLAPCAPAKSKTSSPVDSDYVLALGTANDFLRAWQTQDREAGILLLTDHAKEHASENALLRFFSPSACRSQSFEIQRGRKLGPGRYRFPVALFQQPSGASAKWMRPQQSSLVVVRRNSTEWSIDKLP
jgi:hypothetical protein